MRYKVTWTMYFTDNNIPDTIAVAIVEAASVSKARYAAYKQMIPDRGYRFEWFINETEVEKIEMENEHMMHKLKILPQYFEDKLQGMKKWEVRKNDRPFKAGDTLQLEEWSEKNRIYRKAAAGIYKEDIYGSTRNQRRIYHYEYRIYLSKL